MAPAVDSLPFSSYRVSVMRSPDPWEEQGVQALNPEMTRCRLLRGISPLSLLLLTDELQQH